MTDGGKTELLESSIRSAMMTRSTCCWCQRKKKRSEM